MQIVFNTLATDSVFFIFCNFYVKYLFFIRNSKVCFPKIFRLFIIAVNNIRTLDSPTRNSFDIEGDCDVLDLVITEFHMLLLYRDHVTIVCTLNEQKITDDFISSKFVNFCFILVIF